MTVRWMFYYLSTIRIDMQILKKYRKNILRVSYVWDFDNRQDNSVFYELHEIIDKNDYVIMKH